MIMLDTNHCLSFEPSSPMGSPPSGDDLEKADFRTDLDRDVYHSLKEALQLKLQQRRTREELVSQGIMPPLKSPAAFHEQRRSLERARTEDYLKRKIRSRPERSELVRMHILEETSAEPSLQAKQLQLKRARLADDLNDKISHRPGPIELVHKNILPVVLDALPDSPKGPGGESSLDEDSSDALSPDQLTNHDSPLGSIPQLSPSDMLTQNEDMSPSQFLSQPPPPPPPLPPPLTNGTDSPLSQRLTNGTTAPAHPRLTSGQAKSKSSSDRPPQRSKKAKDNKPKVKKLKYHQYIPPDQKADKEPPPQLDSSYAKILQQQQLFLQLQILNQQQQHYNYHTILPAPPKPPTDPAPSTKSGPSPSRSLPTTTVATPSNQSGPNRQSQTPMGGAKPSTLPANLDEFKVAELKQELKLRGLTVSGTKNDLIERLRNYQEQNGGAAARNGTPQPAQPLAINANTLPGTHHQPGEGLTKVPSFSLAQGPVPGRVMRFGSTSSSPPVSPTPSDRSLAGMSPDETSCNGDMFGEMVSSPLTQLTLQHSPQNPADTSSLAQVKEESQGQPQHGSSCSLSGPSAGRGQPPGAQALQPQDTSASLDKDQMLQEKDKQIEELTRMLKQKQRLVETLRSQLEHKVPGGAAPTTAATTAMVVVERGGTASTNTPTLTSPATPSEAKLIPQTLFKASVLQPPVLPNGTLVRVKKEADPHPNHQSPQAVEEEDDDDEEAMEGVTEEAHSKRGAQATQCSRATLLKLQQIRRLQVQQAEQQQLLKRQQVQAVQQKATEAKQTPQPARPAAQKAEAGRQLVQQPQQQQQQQLQQLIIQQTQQKQLQAQQRLLAQQKLIAQAKQTKQAPSPAKTQAQNPVRVQQQTQGGGQQKNQVPLRQVDLVQVQKCVGSHVQQKRPHRVQQQQQRPQQSIVTPTQQAAPVFINQLNSSQVPTQTISLDLLKANGAPTLVTDGNGNHYLIALTSNTTEAQSKASPGKTNGRIMLQRLQSTPSKLPSQSVNPPAVDPKSSEPPVQPQPVEQSFKKVQKAGLHLETNGAPEPSHVVSAPPSLQPFFDDMADSECQSTLISSLKSEETCPPYDRHALFTPPSPKPKSPFSAQRPKENGLNSQQMDDLFDILLKSGEISGFKANPDPSLAHLHSDPPSPASPPLLSPLHLSPPSPPPANPPAPLASPGRVPAPSGGRLEDFLDATSGGGALLLMDDLHSQMLGASGLLEHATHSPMDTSDLGFSAHHHHPSPSLGFEDPTMDSMDWLDISMAGGVVVGGEDGGVVGGRGAGLGPLAPPTPPSVFSADFLDSADLQLHWESCL